MTFVMDNPHCETEAVARRLERHEDTEEREMFAILQEYWRVNSATATDVAFTSVILCGPPSVAKQAIVEHLLGFPIAEEKGAFAFVQPLVITTLRLDDQRASIQLAGREEEVLHTAQLIDRLRDLDDCPPLGTSKPVAITLSGPHVLSRRLVVLPDRPWMSADECDHFLKAHLVDNPNVIIVSTDCELDVTKAPIAQSLARISPSKAYTDRVLFCLGDSDHLLRSHSLKEAQELLTSYADFTGSSIFIERNPSVQGSTHSAGRRLHPDIDVDGEAAVSGDAQAAQNLLASPTGMFKIEIQGYDALLCTLDRIVLDRDGPRLRQLQCDLLAKASAIRAQVETCSEDITALGSIASDVRSLAGALINVVRDIQFSDGSCATSVLMADAGVLKRFGMDLKEEEEVFLNEHYNPYLNYKCLPLGSQRQFNSTEDTVKAWLQYIDDAPTPNVNFAHTRLLTGAVLGRLQAAWAAHVFRFVRPTKYDEEKLANMHGYDTGSNGEHAAKRAKHLTAMYCAMLRPAIHYYCQWNVFALKRIFEVAWDVARRDPIHRRTLRLHGDEEGLYQLLLAAFEEILTKHAAQAFTQVFADLEGELASISTSGEDSSPIQGLLAAFPASARKVRAKMRAYLNTLPSIVLESFGDDLPTDPHFIEGIRDGEHLLRFTGQHPVSAVTGVILADLVEELGISTVKKEKKKEAEEEYSPSPSVSLSGMAANHPQKNMRSLGFGCVLYTHSLPRYIDIVHHCLARDFWGSTQNDQYRESLVEAVTKTDHTALTSMRRVALEDKEKALRKQETVLNEALSRLNVLWKVTTTAASKRDTPNNSATGDRKRSPGGALPPWRRKVRESSYAAKRRLEEKHALARAEKEARDKEQHEACERAEQEAFAAAKAKAKQEAKAKAKREAKAKAEQLAKANAKELAKAKAEKEAKAKAEQEAKAKAEQEAKAKAEQEAKAKAEQEAKAKAEADAKAKAAAEAKAEAKAKAEQQAKAKAEQEAKAKAEADAKAKAEAEAAAKAKAEQEAKAKAEQQAKAKAEQEAKAKAEADAKAKAEADAMAKAAADAKAKAEAEAKAKAEQQAKAKAEQEAKAKAEADAKAKAEAKAKAKAEQQAKAKPDEDAKK